MQPSSNCVDPDHYLDLSGAVPITRDDVVKAWEKAYNAVESKLSAIGAPATLYVVYGLQGAGKTTWARKNSDAIGNRGVILSGPLPSRARRQRALKIARRMGCRAVAVWINTPFDICMARISLRQGLERVREEAVRHVLERLEPPALDEGFDEVLEVKYTPQSEA